LHFLFPGVEALKFGSIFGSLPDFPSLHSKAKKERSQVALFLPCVVNPVYQLFILCIYFSAVIRNCQQEFL